MNSQNKSSKLILKQNILKNITVLAITAVLTLWILPYMENIHENSGNAFLFLSIFPLGAMFAYFAFSYANTNLNSIEHRVLADASTFIFLTIICFSISMTTTIGIISIPQLKFPFILLASLLIIGCLIYDFWDLYSNLEK